MAVVVMRAVVAIALMKIAVVIAIRVVVMLEPAPGALPAARKIVLTVITRSHPCCPLIRRLAPISVVPLVTVTYRVPVAFHKYVAGARIHRLNPNNPWFGRGPDPDADGNLGE
jgi:hypothetical protein